MNRKRIDQQPEPPEIASVRRGLAAVFAGEWEALTPDQQLLVLSDVLEGFEVETKFDLNTYRRRIGVGNLLSYVKVLEVQS